MKKLKHFMLGMTFMVVFGIIDNLFLIIGMDWLKSIIPDINDIVNGGLGNTFSDAVGVILGIYASKALAKILKIDESEIKLSENLIGVIVGCLIPIIAYVVIA